MTERFQTRKGPVMANMVKAAKKAWKTRRANEEAAKWTQAGKKSWVTRRANARKRSNMAKKAWRTIRENVRVLRLLRRRASAHD